MVEVPLANGRGVALVDDEDAALVGDYIWHLHEAKGARYARSKVGGYMHRLLAELGPGDRREVDHRNGDGLDNRRQNMRVLTHAQNQQNRHQQRGRTSRYRGVTWYASRRQWMVRAKVRGVEHFGGYFHDEHAAGRAAVALRERLMPHSTT
jgi:hypothetical protein